MTGPLEQRLQQLADGGGWRLEWRASPYPALPRLTITELDIRAGRRLVTEEGPLVVISGGEARPRETLARQVLNVVRQYREAARGRA